MKDEIKEIKISKSNHSIVIIKNGVTVKEQFAIDDEILDYITNLQQENQDIKDTLQDKLDYIGHLKELCDKYEEEHNTEFKIWKDERCQLLDYKSRNEKAIEYINENWGHWCSNHYKYATETINILKGSDK